MWCLLMLTPVCIHKEIKPTFKPVSSILILTRVKLRIQAEKTHETVSLLHCRGSLLIRSPL